MGKKHTRLSVWARQAYSHQRHPYTSQPRCPGAMLRGGPGRVKDTDSFGSGIQALQDEFLYNLGIGIPPVSNRRQVTHWWGQMRTFLPC